MEHPACSSSSRETSNVFSFDPQFIAAAMAPQATPSCTDMNTSLPPSSTYKPNSLGHNGVYYSHSTPGYAPCLPDSILNSARNDIPSCAYGVPHVTSMPHQQPTWMRHSPSPHVSTFSPANHQLANVSNHIVHPPSLSMPNTTVVGPHSAHMCNFGGQLFPAQVQYMPQYQNMVHHPPQNMINPQPDVSLATQCAWSQQAQYVPQDLYASQPRQVYRIQQSRLPSTVPSQSAVKSVQPPNEQNHKIKNSIENTTLVQKHTSLPKHIVKPIPVYTSEPQTAFVYPSSKKFQGNCHLQKHSVTEPTPIVKEDKADVQPTNHIPEKEESNKVKVEDDIVVVPTTGINPRQGRKRLRAVGKAVDSEVEIQLEEEFCNKRTPSQAELSEMVERYDVGKSVLRSWFSRRRQKEKKLEKVAASKVKNKGGSSLNRVTPLKNLSELLGPEAKLVIPSQTHDITIEVPSIDPKDEGSIIHKDYMQT